MKIIKYLIILFLFHTHGISNANDKSFNEWLTEFKTYALKNNISEKTFDLAMSDVVFLPKVIKYDRFQPEFYEDTKTYISKRSSNQKIKQGTNLYKSNESFINSIDKKFSVEKSLLLALMGIETNFGTYVGKMDILSSLATLSFDKRRSEFFTKELITILQLVEANKNDVIELKSTKDSFASAANYINKIGWKKYQPCFIRVNLTEDVPKKLLNTSAKKLHNKSEFRYLRKYIKNKKDIKIDDNLISSIITPDKDIIPNSENLEPAYIVFENYEKILQWNRSLRFGLAVCTLKDKFENVL